MPSSQTHEETPKYPLSGLQASVWIDQLFYGDVPLYADSTYAIIDEPLDREVFARALAHVLAHNDALRLVMVEGDDGPWQRVLPPPDSRMPPDLMFVDLSADDGAEERALRWMEAAAAVPFRLYEGPLCRFALIRVGPARYYWLATYHHLIMDGWVVTLVVERVAAAYRALLAGQALAGGPAPSYLDFVRDDQAYLASAQFQADAAYWTELFSTLPEPLFQRRVDVQRGVPSRTSEVDLSPTLCADLRAFAAAHRTSLPQIFLGAVYGYFVRTGRREDLAIGLFSMNRGSPTFKQTVGMFSNMIAAWYRLGAERSFLGLLEGIHETNVAGVPHRRFPLGELGRRIGLLGIERTHPFDISLSFMSRTCEARFGEAPVALRTMASGFLQDGLSLRIEDLDVRGSIRVLLEGSAAMFAPGDLERLQERLVLVLAAAIRDPQRPISELPLMPEAERRQVVEAWNRTEAPFPGETCVHRRFEAQARRTPDALAVLDGEREWTYQALDRQANGLAHVLREQGVGPEVPVALLLERGFEAVVAILGVLKAGGAYVPLDPRAPSERLGWILGDTRAPIVVTGGPLAEQARALAEPLGCRVIRVDGELVADDLAPESGVGPHDLAYVIYTSGSTGRPKGVLIEHRSVGNHCAAWQRLLELGPGMRVLQFAPLVFDAAVWELYPALASGAAVCIPPGEARLPGAELVRFLREQHIHVMGLTPSVLAVLPPAELPALRHLLTGGEACPAELVDRWAPGRTMWNGYGPTEATCDATNGRCVAGSGKPSIGRPLANMRVYILDERQQPMPVGVPGELYIGGVGVARGYLGRPDLTAQKFIADPFEPGARLYRTGDLARFLADGAVEFLGRIDDQIKLRGHRIELGEIEAVLATHAAVAACVVLCRDDAPVGPRLVAYVIARDEAAPSDASLRAHLATSLPEYMLPAAFVRLDELPRTPNDKIDRKRLPAPCAGPSPVSAVPPRSPLEQLVADLFARLLQYDRVGAHDSFFALGGHSLLAAQLVARVRSALAVELPLRAVFESPTVADLARVIASLRAGGATVAAPIERVRRDGPLPMSSAQQRLWFLDRMEPGRAVYNVPVTLRVRGSLDVPALQAALTQLVRRHEALRTTFEAYTAGPLQRIHPAPDLWPLSVLSLQATPAAELESELHLRVQDEAHRLFSLQTGPLLRTTLLRLGPEDHALLLTMHHIVTDGWSGQVLLRELAELYGRAMAGEHAPLAELSLQPADVAVWEQGSLDSERMRQDLGFWTQELAGCEPLELPTDLPRPAAPSHRGGSTSFALPRELSTALKRLGQQHGATLFMTLLGAFQVLLSRYSRQQDFCVGVPVNNRDREDMEPLVGLFVNTLVLRARMEGDLTFVELLQRVRRTSLEAHTHAALPFDRLVDALAGRRDLSRNPLFQVMFAFQGAPSGRASLPGLQVSTLPVETESAKFDLTLEITEHEDGSLNGRFEYARDLYRAETVQRMAGHLERLLAGITTDPEQRITELSWLPEAERRQVVEAWNRTEAPFPGETCVHRRFEAQARRTPDALAVLDGEREWTYQALDRQANGLAHVLREQGVGPEVPVALLLERGFEAVVAILGVLKAGGAYVPLDPRAPSERLGWILGDTRAPIVVTGGPLAEQARALAEPLGCRVIRVDGELVADDLAPESGVGPHDLAYVIYTSGSTGRPKGVLIEHRSVGNHCAAWQRLLELGPGMRVLQFAPLVFDAAVWELYPALASGAAVCIPPGEARLPGAELVRFLREQRIHVMGLTPSVLAALPPAELPALRHVLTGGEACPAELVDRWAPGRTMWNGYGPTEATCDATTGRCVAGSGKPSIGRPLANMRVYILDERQQPMPVGVPGELYIGGVGVARGYLGRPDLTAQKFIADPFEPGARLYRTGDLARFLADGAVEFLGRIDDQIKLRGHRIELGEIEAVLATHAAVAACVVLCRDDAPVGPRLVAYVIARDEAAPSDASLRAHLATSLPEYMLPAVFVRLDELPRTPNDKIDRKRLPAPAREGERSEYLPPRTPAEQVLADAFARVLGLDRVGIHDNFFALGGHSLLTVQIASLAEQGGLMLSVRDVVAHPTVAELASLPQRAQRPSPSRSCLVPLVAGQQPGAIVLIPAVGGHLSLPMLHLARGLGGLRPVIGLTTPPHAYAGPMPETLPALCEQYVSEVLTHVATGPVALLGYCYGGYAALETAAQLRAAGRVVEQVILLETTAPSLLAAADEPYDRVAALLRIAALWGIQFDVASLRGLPEEQVITELMRALSATDRAAADAESTLRAILATQEAHLEMLGRWVPPTQQVPVSLLRAAQREDAPPDYGWSAHAELAGVYIIPGDHFGVVRPPHIETTARYLTELLHPR